MSDPLITTGLWLIALWLYYRAGATHGYSKGSREGYAKGMQEAFSYTLQIFKSRGGQ